MSEAVSFVTPNWPAPDNVRAVSTTRQGGISKSPYDGLNLGDHVGDEPASVWRNRDHLQQQLKLPSSPAWLQQVHGTHIHSLVTSLQQPVTADASVTVRRGLVCAVMTADCLPLLLCDRTGRKVAAIHAGWRGLCAGIIEKTIQQMQLPVDQLLVWLGPAIGPQAFEVGGDVRDAFVAQDGRANEAFVQRDECHWLADIYLLARQRLMKQGVEAVFGGEFCTHSQAELFYSYRRDGTTGRMASLIWME